MPSHWRLGDLDCCRQGLSSARRPPTSCRWRQLLRRGSCGGLLLVEEQDGPAQVPGGPGGSESPRTRLPTSNGPRKHGESELDVS